MWPFDGPIHLINTKYGEMNIGLETYDSSLRGAAVEVTRDGAYHATLGNYRSVRSWSISGSPGGVQEFGEFKLNRNQFLTMSLKHDTER